MRRIFTLSLCILVASQVLGAPSDRYIEDEGDSVEQELIRNHHSTAAERRLKSKTRQYSSEMDESSPIESIEDVEDSEDEDDRSITDDEIYDITVGDVIRDVLLTLRDHPEIVKQLIASEKAKLSQQIDAFNNLVDGDSAGDSLAGYMKPAEQLKTLPKNVEKKTGRSGMPVVPGEVQVTEKRADEVINDEYTRDEDTRESEEYKDFLIQPEEGGKDDPMFDNEKSQHSVSEESSVSKSTDEDSETVSNSGDNTVRLPYRFPFLNPQRMFKSFGRLSTSENNRHSEESSDSQDTDETHQHDSPAEKDGLNDTQETLQNELSTKQNGNHVLNKDQD